MNPESMPMGNSGHEDPELSAKQERLAGLKAQISEAVSAQAYNNANAANISPEAHASFEESFKDLQRQHDELEREIAEGGQ